jgi:hypothetical protein
MRRYIPRTKRLHCLISPTVEAIWVALPLRVWEVPGSSLSLAVQTEVYVILRTPVKCQNSTSD